MVSDIVVVNRWQECSFEQVEGSCSIVLDILSRRGLRGVNSHMPAKSFVIVRLILAARVKVFGFE
jgi:hypothetical protein